MRSAVQHIITTVEKPISSAFNQDHEEIRFFRLHYNWEFCKINKMWINDKYRS